MKDNDMLDVSVFLGGIIPNDDIPALEEMGITGVFGPGTSTDLIVKTIRETVLGERSN
jgi:methylmalonyl-CoA mutase C-terminal domain/subunit